MAEISMVLFSSLSGEVTSLEAVGPGDGYHLTFRTAEGQRDTLRNGITQPTQPKPLDSYPLTTQSHAFLPSAPRAPPTTPT